MIVVKKYSNRKLYLTTNVDGLAVRGFVNNSDLFNIIRSGEDITVLDNDSGVDITEEALLEVMKTAMIKESVRIKSKDLLQLIRK